MKNLYYIFVLIFCCFTMPLNAQVADFIKSFKGSEIENRIELSWIIERGKSCNDIYIYRAIDNSSFKRIHTIYGVCGSEFNEQEFRFLDSFPVKNKKNYYFLELGGVGFSQVLEIEQLELAKEELQIRFDEAGKKYHIFVENESSKNLTLRLFDIRANQVLSAESFTNSFEIDTQKFINGTYIIQVFDENNILIGQDKLNIVN